VSAGNAGAHLTRWLGSTKGSLRAPVSDAEPRRVLPIQEIEKVRESRDSVAGRGIPREWLELYDWALVWRYWHGTAQGLRRPYPLEQWELLRLGRSLTQAQLAERLGLPERTICRWRSR
jgi:hypothetical protein